MPGSNGKAPPDAASASAELARRKLARVEHERREAVYVARTAEGEQCAPPRDKLPTLDDLTDSGPVGKTARWKLIVAAVAALSTIAGAASQLVGLLR